MTNSLRPTKLARKLLNGVKGKLDFDFANERGHLFGEYHLHCTINEIIASNIDHRYLFLKPAFAPISIQKENASRGRKREIDFAVMERSNVAVAGSAGHGRQGLRLAVEAKWASSSHCTPSNILLDLCRLTLIAQSEDVSESLFILAGPKSVARKLLSEKSFAPKGHKQQQPLRLPPRDSASRYNLKTTGGQSGLLSSSDLNFLRGKLPSVPQAISTRPETPAVKEEADWFVGVWHVYGSHKP